jgi:hypothetical protein
MSKHPTIKQSDMRFNLFKSAVFPCVIPGIRYFSVYLVNIRVYDIII